MTYKRDLNASSKPLKFLWWNLKLDPYTEGRERPWKEAGRFRLVGGGFNRQENALGGLPRVASYKTSQSLHPPLESHEFVHRGFNGVQSHVQSRWSRQHHSLLVWKTWVECTVYSKDRSRGRSLWLPRSSSQVNLLSHPISMTSLKP